MNVNRCLFLIHGSGDSQRSLGAPVGVAVLGFSRRNLRPVAESFVWSLYSSFMPFRRLTLLI